MSEQHDERLTLPIEEGVLLWCMRAWVLELRRPLGAEQRIDDMLDRFGTPGAAPCFKGFMFALSHGAARLINVRCTGCMRISEDERTLLDALGLAQAMRPFEALLVLHGLARPEDARAMLRSAEGIGTVLAQAGRFLPAPDAGVRHFALATRPIAAAWPANAMVHWR
jgi:hypothetical protein